MPKTQLEAAAMQQSDVHCVALGATRGLTSCFMLTCAYVNRLLVECTV